MEANIYEKVDIAELVLTRQRTVAEYLAEVYNVPVDVILEIVYSSKRSNPKEVDPSIEKFILDATEIGATYQQLDEYFGLSISFVSSVLRSHNIVKRRGRRSNVPSVDFLRVLYNSRGRTSTSLNSHETEIDVDRAESFAQIKPILSSSAAQLRAALNVEGSSDVESEIYDELSDEDIQQINSHFVDETEDIVRDIAEELDVDTSVVIDATFEAPTLAEELHAIDFISKGVSDEERFKFLLLRQCGCNYRHIAYFYKRLTNSKEELPLGLIDRVIRQGFPTRINYPLYNSVKAQITKLLDLHKQDCAVLFDLKELEPHHLLPSLSGITVADVEYMDYLSSRYLLNVYEIKHFAYQRFSYDQIRAVFQYMKKRPSSTHTMDFSNVSEVIHMRNQDQMSVKDIADSLRIKEEKVMFIIDSNMCSQSEVVVKDYRGLKEYLSFIDPVRKISGSIKTNILTYLREGRYVTAQKVIDDLGLSIYKISCADIRSLMYARQYPINMALEFPKAKPQSPQLKVSIPSRSFEYAPVNRIYGSRPLVITSKVEIVEAPVKEPVAPVAVVDKRLYPLQNHPDISVAKIERLCDLNTTFGLTLSEIIHFEILSMSEEQLLEIFKLAGVKYDATCSEVSGQRKQKIMRNLKKVSSLKELADLHAMSLEKLKFLVRHRRLPVPDNEVSFNYKSEAQNICGVSSEDCHKIVDDYPEYDSETLREVYGLGSRADIRRILAEHNKPLRLEEEFLSDTED